MLLIRSLGRGQPLKGSTFLCRLDGDLGVVSVCRTCLNLYTTYININDFMKFHRIVEFDLQRGAVRTHGRKKLPMHWRSSHLDAADLYMIGIEDNLLRLSVGGGSEFVNDISDEFLLLEQNLKVDSAMGTHPVIVIGQGVGVPGRVDECRHTTPVELQGSPVAASEIELEDPKQRRRPEHMDMEGLGGEKVAVLGSGSGLGSLRL